MWRVASKSSERNYAMLINTTPREDAAIDRALKADDLEPIDNMLRIIERLDSALTEALDKIRIHEEANKEAKHA